MQWGWISLQELLPPFALTSLNSLSSARSFLRRMRFFTHNTHARDTRRIFIYIHRDISISFTLLRTPFSLPPPLLVERPSLLKFLAASTAPRKRSRKETCIACSGLNKPNGAFEHWKLAYLKWREAYLQNPTYRIHISLNISGHGLPISMILVSFESL